MQVLCLSLVTNKAIMEGDEGRPVASHAEVLEAVGERSIQMQTLVKEIIKVFSRESLGKIPDLPPVSLHRANAHYKKLQSIKETMISYESLAFGAVCLATGALLTTLFSSFARR
jgi:hypothetical protein